MKTKTIILSIVVFLIVISFSVFQGGRLLENYEQSLIKKELKKQDSIQKASDSIIEILTDSITNGQFKVMVISEELRIKNINNWILTKKLEEREKSLDNNDTVFISNARRIARSSNRFYQQNDTIRQSRNDSAR